MNQFFGSSGDSTDSSIFGATQDTNMDLSSFFSKPQTPDTTSQNSSNDTKGVQNTSRQLTPLEEELQRKKDTGIVYTAEQLEKGKEPTEFRHSIDTDERVEDFNALLDENADLIRQREACVMLKPLKRSTDFAHAVHELSLVKFDENGKAYFDYERDEKGNPIKIEWFRLRQDDDPPFNSGIPDSEIADGSYEDGDDPAETIDVDLDALEEEDDDVIETSEDDQKVSDKKRVVQVIIDKTGYGSDIHFTPEEKEKLTSTREIRLREVEVLDLASINVRRPSKREGFIEHIHNHQLRGPRTTISFPASGFKADVTGLTYGEIGDITLSMDTVSVDKYRKRLSTIYNKLCNLSCGSFESFDDFLRNFAYTDIPLAIYALFVASFPEIQTVSLRCGNKKCNESFEWRYETRNVIRLEKSDKVFLDKMAELASADPSEYDEIYERAAVRNSKIIKLPMSGYLVELGIASAYEFLNNLIPLMDDATFRSAFGQDPNKVYTTNMLLLTTVLSVYVPDGTRDETGRPNYYHYETYKDILDAIYTIDPDEIQILANLSAKFQSQYQSYFSFLNTQCPHCGHKTAAIDVTMDDLVFQTYQRLLSTEVDVTAIQTL